MAEVRQNPTEARIGELAPLADLRMNTGRWPATVTYWRVRRSIFLRSVLLRGRAEKRTFQEAVAIACGPVAAVALAPWLVVDHSTYAQSLAIVGILLVAGITFTVWLVLGAASPIPRRRSRSVKAETRDASS